MLPFYGAPKHLEYMYPSTTCFIYLFIVSFVSFYLDCAFTEDRTMSYSFLCPQRSAKNLINKCDRFVYIWLDGWMDGLIDEWIKEVNGIMLFIPNYNLVG